LEPERKEFHPVIKFLSGDGEIAALFFIKQQSLFRVRLDGVEKKLGDCLDHNFLLSFKNCEIKP
jgi:hypothetical protein